MNKMKLVLPIFLLTIIIALVMVMWPTEPIKAEQTYTPHEVKDYYNGTVVNVDNKVHTITVPNNYTLFVDSDYGFYKIRGPGVPNEMGWSFTGKLNINVNDTITFINDDSYDYPVYVKSKEGLWSGYKERLRYNYERMSYTFNETGAYNITTPSKKNKELVVVVK